MMIEWTSCAAAHLLLAKKAEAAQSVKLYFMMMGEYFGGYGCYLGNYTKVN